MFSCSSCNWDHFMCYSCYLGQAGMFFCSANESFPCYFALLTSSHHIWYLICLQVMDSGVFYVIEKNNAGAIFSLSLPYFYWFVWYSILHLRFDLAAHWNHGWYMVNTNTENKCVCTTVTLLYCMTHWHEWILCSVILYARFCMSWPTLIWYKLECSFYFLVSNFLFVLGQASPITLQNNAWSGQRILHLLISVKLECVHLSKVLCPYYSNTQEIVMSFLKSYQHV
jgi:hypothetical protein